jgi:hypothetical protein
MAHYDGVPGGPAAGDDAAGTAAILETVRALRASPPLAHDIIILITDGEEAGLLGAAAFVREHPWAKDVGVTLNFEARGTTGRSYMFETGPGNLDVARVLRAVHDVSATSLSVTVYRSLPNDTDLSEVAVLGKPALNFAFAGGVERYHTSHDNLKYLNPGSLQHHGTQMLTLARAFGDGPLPRPVTGDGVFFDMPIVGLIVYPYGAALPLAIFATVLVLAALGRLVRDGPPWGGGVILGAVATVAGTAIAGGVTMLAGNTITAMHDRMGWGGAAPFRGIYTAVLAALAVTIAVAVWAIVRRLASALSLYVGVLIVWCLITIIVTVKLPGVSFMFVWPLIFAAIAALAARSDRADRSGNLTPTVALDVLGWTAAIIGLAVIAPIVYTLSAVLLGAMGPGALAVGALVAPLVWLLVPQLEAIGAQRWLATGVAFITTVVLLCIGMTTVRSSPEHPTSSIVAYAHDADSADAWVAARGPIHPASSGSAPNDPPAWLSRLVGRGAQTWYASARRADIPAPTSTVVSDSTSGSERSLVVRIVPPPGANTLNLQTNGARVLRATIDGRAIETTRYRGGARGWRLDYNGPPASGITLGLVVPAGNGVSLVLMSRAPGLPPSVQVPERPDDVVPIQTGDISIVHRVVRIP